MAFKPGVRLIKRGGAVKAPSRKDKGDEDEVQFVGEREKKAKMEPQEQVGMVEQVEDAPKKAYSCPYGCTRYGPWTRKEEMLRHLCSPQHHSGALRRLLPEASKQHPFECPRCELTHRVIAGLTRHYGLACGKYSLEIHALANIPFHLQASW